MSHRNETGKPADFMSSHRYERARRGRRLLLKPASVLLASVIATVSTYGVAQITNGGGSDNQDSRQPDSSSRADPSGTPMHESQKPQSKDAAKGRAATAGNAQQSNGSSGFDNGLYGTGAGSNK